MIVRMIDINTPIKIFLAGLLIMLLISCGKKQESYIDQAEIVAKVGDRAITADEFKYNFEFGLSTFRQGPDARKTYLNYMIKELLLASEGYRLGLNKSEYVQSRLERRRYNTLLESYIQTNVRDKVDIPDQEVRDALKKSTVTFKLLILPAPSQNEAEQIRAAASESSLSAYLDKKLQQAEMPLEDKRKYQTGWVDFLDLPPHVLEKVVDLDMGHTSEPFRFGEGYAVAEVLDINRTSITQSELEHGRRKRDIQARLYNIEADRIVRGLMDSVLTPMQVRVKGGVVQDLTKPLYEWFQAGLPDNQSIFDMIEEPPDSARDYVEPIKALMDETLVTMDKGEKTVRDYLEHMDYYRKALGQSASFDDFSTRLTTEIGRWIKNDTFVNLADQEGLADDPGIQRDLERWEQKWTYDMYRHETVKELSVTEEEMKDYFKHRWRELDIANVDTTRFYKYKNAVHNALLHEKQTALLEEETKELKNRYPVWIDHDLLYEIDLVDSLKSSQTSYFLRDKFSGQGVIPIVDMKWMGF